MSIQFSNLTKLFVIGLYPVLNPGLGGTKIRIILNIGSNFTL